MVEAKTFGELLNTDEPDEEPAIEAQEAAPEPGAESAPMAEQAGRPRDEPGKLVKKGEEGAPPAPAEKQEFDGAATIAERRKRQEAEAELERLRAQLQQQQQSQQEQQRFDPDIVYSDAAAFTSHLQTEAAMQALNVKMDISEEVAREKYGDELVDQARDWTLSRYQTDPGFRHKVMTQRNPYRFAVEEYQRAQIVENVTPDDYAAFQKWREAQAAPAQQIAEPPKLPPTLTGERNVGARTAPVDVGPSTFGEILNH